MRKYSVFDKKAKLLPIACIFAFAVTILLITQTFSFFKLPVKKSPATTPICQPTMTPEEALDYYNIKKLPNYTIEETLAYYGLLIPFKMVFVTSGNWYFHYSQCENYDYTLIPISEALEHNLKPCNKCCY